MAGNKQTSELKHIKPGTGKGRAEKRDPTMADGERGVTPREREADKRRKSEPKEAPIIQKDVT